MNFPEKSPGHIYFSPAINPVAGSEIDVSNVKFTSCVADTYTSPQAGFSAARPLILGPTPVHASERAWPPDFSFQYAPKLNSPEYGLVCSRPGNAVHGELFNTTTMETVQILV